MIFQDEHHARLLWSKNLDEGDIPSCYPANLEIESEKGVMQGMNVSKLTRMQRSFRWQPYLPFTPVNINTCPWFRRYHFKYDTLPIVEINPGRWALRKEDADGWFSHWPVFNALISSWTSNLAAPLTVTWLQSVRNMNVYQDFPTEKQARGHSWHYRTMMYALFAQFSYEISLRPNWQQRAPFILKEQGMDFRVLWGAEVERVLGHSTSIKRAGVVIDVATTTRSCGL
jgi:hypothetical protein